MRHLEANIAFWKRAAAELQTPAQLQHVKFPRDLPQRFLQLAEATGKEGASAVDQMPPLDELTRQLEVQMLEKGQQHSMDDFNAEIASAVAHHHDHGQEKASPNESGSDGANSSSLSKDEQGKEALHRPSQPLPRGQGAGHERASARGAAFLFSWGGLFARYTPPQRNFLAYDLGFRKVKELCLALSFSLPITALLHTCNLLPLLYSPFLWCTCATFRRCLRYLWHSRRTELVWLKR
jgi:hypothetical protein